MRRLQFVRVSALMQLLHTTCTLPESGERVSLRTVVSRKSYEEPLSATTKNANTKRPTHNEPFPSPPKHQKPATTTVQAFGPGPYTPPYR